MSTRHKVSFTDKATGDIDNLSDKEYKRIIKGCLRFETDPYPDGKHIKKLKGYQDLYRLRIGNYRVIFEWKGEDIIVIRVLTRQDFGKKY